MPLSTKNSERKEYKQWSLNDVWANIEKKYKIEKTLGKGSYGTVKQAVCIATGQVVAIKHMTGFAEYEYDCVKVLREIQIMRGLKKMIKTTKGCFIPQILEVIVPDSQLYSKSVKDVFVVMEFEMTDLQKLFSNGNQVSFDKNHLKYVIYNLMCAIKFIGSANVVHRDLKPNNILINDQCQVKICDFGLARTLPEGLDQFT
jgi:mitogen-activated protein kinase 1/3